VALARAAIRPAAPEFGGSRCDALDRCAIRPFGL